MASPLQLTVFVSDRGLKKQMQIQLQMQLQVGSVYTVMCCAHACGCCGALQHAAAAGFKECIPLDLLLECGADIDWQDENGITALSMATREGHARDVQLLIDRGKQTSQCTTTSKTHHADDNQFRLHFLACMLRAILVATGTRHSRRGESR